MSDSKIVVAVCSVLLMGLSFSSRVQADLTEKQLREVWEKGVEAGQTTKRESLNNATVLVEDAKQRFASPPKPEYKDPKPSRLPNKTQRERADKIAKKTAKEEFEEKLKLWEELAKSNDEFRAAGVRKAEKELAAIKDKVVWLPPEIILSRIDSVGFLSHTVLLGNGPHRVIQFRRMIDGDSLPLFTLDRFEELVTVVHGFNTETLVHNGLYVCSRPVIVEKPVGSLRYPKLRILNKKECDQLYQYIRDQGYPIDAPKVVESDLAGMVNDSK